MNRLEATLSRRTIVAATAALGAVAAAVQLQRAASHGAIRPPQAGSRPAPAGTEGYRLSAHVQQYYRTARI